MSDQSIELEMRLAYQDRKIEQLGEALLEQLRRIEELERRLGQLLQNSGETEPMKKEPAGE